MTQRQYAKLAKLVKATPPEKILAAADICDGHTIFDPQAFITAGLPEAVVAHVTRQHQSDLSNPKTTVFVHGQPVKALAGVYGLDMLRFLVGVLGVEYARALGRGTEARNIQRALHQHLQAKGPPAAGTPTSGS